jgi:hypothetical protein
MDIHTFDDDDDVQPQKKDDGHVLLFPPEIIRTYIEQYVTTDYKESNDGNWININSEFTSDDKYRMGFHLEANIVNDFKLGAMSIVRFVAEHEDINEFQAKQLLSNIGLKIKKGFRRIKRSEFVHVRTEAEDCPRLIDIPETKSFDDNLSPIGERALDYLKSRGLSEKHIDKYDLRYSDTKKCSKCHGYGYTDDEDQCDMCNGTGANFFYSRIIIPSYENKNLVYMQGRTIKDGGNELRYQNIKAGRLQVVYFYDLLEPNEDIYITEGPIDAMTLYNYNVTSLLNTKISDPQITKILRKNPKRIIFVPDYDETLAKRERITKAITDNMAKIMRQSDYQIPLCVFEWHKMLEDAGRPIKKDINANRITYVDEDYIRTFDQLRLKAATIHKEKPDPYLDDGEE